MDVFGCCNARRTAVNTDRPPPLSYCQVVARSFKLAACDTMLGFVGGAVLAAPYGSYQASQYPLDAQKAHDIFVSAQARIPAGTSTCDDRFGANLYSQMSNANTVNFAFSAFAEPVVVGSLIGGCFGASVGVVRIVRAILCPWTMR